MTDFHRYQPGTHPANALIVKLYRSGNEIRSHCIIP